MTRARTASIVAVGDELLAGLHPDLNSPELARRLARLGVSVLGVRVVRDGEEEIEEAVNHSMRLRSAERPEHASVAAHHSV